MMPTLTFAAPDRRSEAGLTLLEVLAAVMIFAMVMTVLIGTSTSAVHHIGVSSRRLEADLVADNLLSELEIQIKQGTAPAIEEEEFTREQFSVRMWRTAILPDQSGDASDAATGLAGAGASAGGDIVMLLGSALPEVAGHLMQYDIDVSWLEQNGPQSVTRTTFAFDWQAAQAELAAFAQDANRQGVSGLGTDDGSGTPNTSLGGNPPNCRGRNAGDCQRAGRAGQGPQP